MKRKLKKLKKLVLDSIVAKMDLTQDDDSFELSEEELMVNQILIDEILEMNFDLSFEEMLDEAITFTMAFLEQMEVEQYENWWSKNTYWKINRTSFK